MRCSVMFILVKTSSTEEGMIAAHSCHIKTVKTLFIKKLLYSLGSHACRTEMVQNKYVYIYIYNNS